MRSEFSLTAVDQRSDWPAANTVRCDKYYIEFFHEKISARSRITSDNLDICFFHVFNRLLKEDNLPPLGIVV